MDSGSSSQWQQNDNLQEEWLSWCRLCAKRKLSELESSSIFIKNETGNCGTELATSVGKYFWVNIKADDEISQCLCMECEQLIQELISFTDRINKVQTLYYLLQNIKPTTIEQVDKLCLQCGVINEQWQHIIKVMTQNVQEIDTPVLIDKEIQSDLITFAIDEEKDTENVIQTSPERDEIISVLQKTEKNTEYQNQSETEVDHIYEYVMNGDNELEFVQNEYIVPSKNENKQDVKQIVIPQLEDNEEVHDNKLLKEMSYKVGDDEESHPREAKNFEILSDMEELEIDYEDSSQSMKLEDEEEMEHSIEILEEDEEGEEYVTISKNQINDIKVNVDAFMKGKRGRPFGSKNCQTDDSRYSFECKECKRMYKNPNVFRKHMLSIHDVNVENLPDFKLYNTCSICGKTFITRGSLKLHMRHHLPDKEKYNVACPYCDRKFSQVGAMRQHVNGIHHQMKPFICDQCGRACKTMAALTEHQLVHTNECPFECEVCHKGFKNKPRLKSHMDIHNKSVYKCEDCGLELNTKRTLLQHRLVHSDVKRFKCEFCDAAFKRSKALKNHLILHSGLRPYKCNFCSKSFSNGSNCRAHKKRAHPKELAEEEANGKERERVPIPRLEELKSAKGVLVQPRKIKRHTGGLTNQLRKLLKSSEKRTEENTNAYVDNGETYEPYLEFQYEINKSEIDETESLVDNPSEECEETVIYEIIDEI